MVFYETQMEIDCVIGRLRRCAGISSKEHQNEQPTLVSR